MESQTKTSRFAWVYPNITDIVTAKEAARQGFWASLFVAAVTGLVAAISVLAGAVVMGIDSAALVDSGLFLFVAWGIHRYSRIGRFVG